MPGTAYNLFQSLPKWAKEHNMRRINFLMQEEYDVFKERVNKIKENATTIISKNHPSIIEVGYIYVSLF